MSSQENKKENIQWIVDLFKTHTASESSIGECASCPNNAKYVCGHCRSTVYCSHECQDTHWEKEHSKVCTLISYDIGSRGAQQSIRNVIPGIKFDISLALRTADPSSNIDTFFSEEFKDVGAYYTPLRVPYIQLHFRYIMNTEDTKAKRKLVDKTQGHLVMVQYNIAKPNKIPMLPKRSGLISVGIGTTTKLSHSYQGIAVRRGVRWRRSDPNFKVPDANKPKFNMIFNEQIGNEPVTTTYRYQWVKLFPGDYIFGKRILYTFTLPLIDSITIMFPKQSV